MFSDLWKHVFNTYFRNSRIFLIIFSCLFLKFVLKFRITRLLMTLQFTSPWVWLLDCKKSCSFLAYHIPIHIDCIIHGLGNRITNLCLISEPILGSYKKSFDLVLCCIKVPHIHRWKVYASTIIITQLMHASFSNKDATGLEE